MKKDTNSHKNFVGLRLDKEHLSRVKKIAQRKGMGHSTLMRSWILEGLNSEEKRKGA